MIRLKYHQFIISIILAVGADSWILPSSTTVRPLTYSRLGVSPKSDDVPSEADVVIIGSGLAGLSCGALLSHCNKNVVVLESHDAPGGCAHTWERRGFHFESGPSLYSGFSSDRSPNPLKNIFQIVGEDCEWIKYDRWGTVLPSGERFAAKIGPEEFGDVLKAYGGPNAEKEFAALMARMKPLSDASQALTSMALREDPAVLLTLLRYPKELLMTFSQGSQLTEPFGIIMEEMQIQDSFVRNWLDMLCFLLQGLPARGTLNTVMVREHVFMNGNRVSTIVSHVRCRAICLLIGIVQESHLIIHAADPEPSSMLWFAPFGKTKFPRSV